MDKQRDMLWEILFVVIILAPAIIIGLIGIAIVNNMPVEVYP